MAKKIEGEININVDYKVIEVTPDKQIKHYFNIIPSTEHKDYPWKGRLDVVVKNIRGNVVQAVYVTVFGKSENDAGVQLHKAVKELGL